MHDNAAADIDDVIRPRGAAAQPQYAETAGSPPEFSQQSADVPLVAAAAAAGASGESGRAAVRLCAMVFGEQDSRTAHAAGLARCRDRGTPCCDNAGEHTTAEYTDAHAWSAERMVSIAADMMTTITVALCPIEPGALLEAACVRLLPTSVAARALAFDSLCR